MSTEKKMSLFQTILSAGAFSAISFWYGFMFGRESARQELGGLIDDLRRANAASAESAADPPTTSVAAQSSVR